MSTTTSSASPHPPPPPAIQYPGTPPLSPQLKPSTTTISSSPNTTPGTIAAASSSPPPSHQHHQPPHHNATCPPPLLSSPLSSSSASSAYRERLMRGVSRLIPESPRKALRSRLSGAAALLAPAFPRGGGEDSCDDSIASAASSMSLFPLALRREPSPSSPRRSCSASCSSIDAQSFAAVRVLSLVSRHWYAVVQHKSMWLHIVKMFFVAYPVVQRLARAAPIDSADEEALLRTVYSTKYLSGRKRSTDNIVSPVLSPSSGSASASADPPPPPSTLPPSLHSSTTQSVAANPPPPPPRLLQHLHIDEDDDNKPLLLTNVGIRKAFKDVRRYLASRRYHGLVLRRRAFVIHAFVSLALLCFSMALLTAMCAAERVFDPIAICDAETSFHFVWLTYLSIVGAVLANIVMETHFEPQPLIRRLRMHTQLIQLSAALLAMSLLLVGLPTLLVQWNVQSVLLQHTNNSSTGTATLSGSEEDGAVMMMSVRTTDAEAMVAMVEGAPFLPWVVCILPVLLALVAWQIEVLYAVRRDIVEFLQMPYFNSATMYHGFSYSLPTLFIIALVCLMEFLELGGDPAYWPLLLIGTMPGGLALFTLTVVFTMDYNLKNQTSDVLAAACCAVANLCPLFILTMEKFRGFTILPLVAASFGFFFGHFHELRKRLDAAMFDPDGERVLFDD
ncbi:transmembrane protein, putative [Bodo saltans]|uniref:Transmembrane protein, putative n=1 Tax=Bodo saltans TaxID=75058 RepID=A0A0S4JHL9_BODSA|nr:transmembrane protein, putative [Bodo saltans]|eukprot:CUG91020.1 transmembrane protein, putative [Bodo saltans]